MPFLKNLGCLALATAVIGCSQERMYEWAVKVSARRLTKELAALDGANRIGITGRDATVTTRSSRDPEFIREVITFFQKYPDGWAIVSGAAGDYYFYLYRDEEMVGRLGLTSSTSVRPGEDTLNVWDYFRRVPSAEAAAFAARIGLPWPPRD